MVHWSTVLAKLPFTHSLGKLSVNTNMSGYDFNLPFIDASSLPEFRAIDSEVAARYGRSVKATPMSNFDYAQRHKRMAQSNNMKSPPSHHRIFSGYLAIRKVGTPGQYETWIPYDAFQDIYAPS